MELLREARPRELVQLLPHEYRPGRVLNQGMASPAADRVIFLNADATPQGPDWLGTACCCARRAGGGGGLRQADSAAGLPAAFARDYERCFGADRRESVGWDHFFSMVSSGLRREPWAGADFGRPSSTPKTMNTHGGAAPPATESATARIRW